MGAKKKRLAHPFSRVARRAARAESPDGVEREVKSVGATRLGCAPVAASRRLEAHQLGWNTVLTLIADV